MPHLPKHLFRDRLRFLNPLFHESSIALPLLFSVPAEIAQNKARVHQRIADSQNGGAVTAPKIILRSRHQAGPNRVQVDVATYGGQVGVFLDRDAVESALENVPRRSMALIESIGIYAVDGMHDF